MRAHGSSPSSPPPPRTVVLILAQEARRVQQVVPLRRGEALQERPVVVELSHAHGHLLHTAPSPNGLHPRAYELESPAALSFQRTP